MSIHMTEGSGTLMRSDSTPGAKSKSILIIGGTGVFGKRLADHLAAETEARLVVTSRNAGKAETIADSLKSKYPGLAVSGSALDTKAGLAEFLLKLKPCIVIDASGPFQASGYEVPRAALEAGAHCIDLADARGYLAGYRSGLDQLARSVGCIACAGASSTPALSTAVVRALTHNWQTVESVDLCITPGGRGEVGEAVVEAVLSYAGRPVPVWSSGALVQRIGWADARRMDIPSLGSRRVARVETYDAELIGKTFSVSDRVAFYAGLENPAEQYGMECLSWLIRMGLPIRATGLASLLHRMRTLTRIGMSDAGGMVVEATGRDETGNNRQAKWSLIAQNGDGPAVPILAASAVVRKLLNDAIEPGAGLAADVLSLEDIEAEMKRYAINVHRTD